FASSCSILLILGRTDSATSGRYEEMPTDTKSARNAKQRAKTTRFSFGSSNFSKIERKMQNKLYEPTKIITTGRICHPIFSKNSFICVLSPLSFDYRSFRTETIRIAVPPIKSPTEANTDIKF